MGSCGSRCKRISEFAGAYRSRRGRASVPGRDSDATATTVTNQYILPNHGERNHRRRFFPLPVLVARWHPGLQSEVTVLFIFSCCYQPRLGFCFLLLLGLLGGPLGRCVGHVGEPLLTILDPPFFPRKPCILIPSNTSIIEQLMNPPEFPLRPLTLMGTPSTLRSCVPELLRACPSATTSMLPSFLIPPSAHTTAEELLSCFICLTPRDARYQPLFVCRLLRMRGTFESRPRAVGVGGWRSEADCSPPLLGRPSLPMVNKCWRYPQRLRSGKGIPRAPALQLHLPCGRVAEPAWESYSTLVFHITGPQFGISHCGTR